MVACEECSWPEVGGVRWYRLLELRSGWRPQKYCRFDTACKGRRVNCIFFCGHDECAARYFRHVPAISIKTTLQATTPLRYACRSWPKKRRGRYASPSPGSNGGCWVVFVFRAFFPHTRVTTTKSRRLAPKKNLSEEKITAYADNKVARLNAEKITTRYVFFTIDVWFPPVSPPPPATFCLATNGQPGLHDIALAHCTLTGTVVVGRWLGRMPLYIEKLTRIPL